MLRGVHKGQIRRETASIARMDAAALVWGRNGGTDSQLVSGVVMNLILEIQTRERPLNVYSGST